MRPTPVRFNRSYGGASRRRSSFVKVTSSRNVQQPVSLVIDRTEDKADTAAVKAA